VGDFQGIEYGVSDTVFLQKLDALFGALVEEVGALGEELRRLKIKIKNLRNSKQQTTHPFLGLQFHQLFMIDRFDVIVVARHPNETIIEVRRRWRLDIFIDIFNYRSMPGDFGSFSNTILSTDARMSFREKSNELFK
jgi:hypothetical protein